MEIPVDHIRLVASTACDTELVPSGIYPVVVTGNED
jgi:hypothetical protein